MFLTIIALVFVLGLLIFSHELGHFISAKKMGMAVEEFGFGFPPRLFKFKKGETVYSLNLIPVGGFVKIKGENGKEKGKRAFCNKPLWQRAIVLAMGVVMNLVLAAVLLSIVSWLGIPSIISQTDLQQKEVSQIAVQILAVAPDSPALTTGLQAGDAIRELHSQTGQILAVTQVEDIQQFVAQHMGEEVTLSIKRGSESLTKTLTPRVSPPENEGPIGIALARTGIIKYSWPAAIANGFKEMGELLISLLGLFYLLIKTLIIKQTLIANIAGPVGIANLTFQMSRLGLVYLLRFTAIISINLAIINFIPFPALDGGRLLFLLIEKIKGSPINPKTEQAANALGFILLLLVMAIITYKDIIKLF